MAIPEISMLAGIFKKKLVSAVVLVIFFTAVIGGLFGQKDSKKSSGCCNIEFEKIKDEKTDNQSNNDNQECNKFCCK